MQSQKNKQTEPQRQQSMIRRSKSGGRAEHKARMARAEGLLLSGLAPFQVWRAISEEHGIGLRQARRYVGAIQAIYRNGASSGAMSLEQAQHASMAAYRRMMEAGEYMAAGKMFDVAARIHGWVAPSRSQVDVRMAVAVDVRRTENLSSDELDALQAFHDARARRLAGGAVDVEAESVTAAPAPVEPDASTGSK